MEEVKMNRGGGANSQHFGHFVPKIVEDCNPLNQSKGKTFAKLKAFTLAEVLITLAIIGIVASLTIPTLVTNYKKKTYVTQLKKTYNYLTNGFHQIMAQDGVSNLSDTKLWSMIPESYSVTTPAQTIQMGNNIYEIPETTTTNQVSVITPNLLALNEFSDFKNELSKTFNIARICDGSENATLEGCTSSIGVQLNDGAIISFMMVPEPASVACSTQTTGTGINQKTTINYCKSLKEFQETRNTPTTLWQGFGKIWFDVNGSKGPNEDGRDIFYFYLGNDGTLYPIGGVDVAMQDILCSYSDLNSCSSYWKTSNTIGCGTNALMMPYQGCAARIMEEDWEMNY